MKSSSVLALMKRLQSHVHILATGIGGRLATSGIETAAAYIEHELRSYGYASQRQHHLLGRRNLPPRSGTENSRLRFCFLDRCRAGHHGGVQTHVRLSFDKIIPVPIQMSRSGFERTLY